MACLVYKPQPIDFAGRKFEKKRLLKQSMKMV